MRTPQRFLIVGQKLRLESELDTTLVDAPLFTAQTRPKKCSSKLSKTSRTYSGTMPAAPANSTIPNGLPVCSFLNT
jgi:hypothetical protein